MSDIFDVTSEPQLMGDVGTGVVRIPPTQTAVEKAVEEYLIENPPAPGEPGPRGEKGDKGDRGVQGPKGDKGDPGVGKIGQGEHSNVLNNGAPEQANGTYSHVEGYQSKTSGHAAHAEGDHTESGWRSHTEGYMTFANNTSHAEGRLTQATGKCAHAEGVEMYVDVIYLRDAVEGYYDPDAYMNGGSVDIPVLTLEPVHIDDNKFIMAANPHLSVGDVFTLSPTDTVNGFTTTDARRIVGMTVYDDVPEVTEYIIDAPFRAANYYEGYNCPEDGIIPAGAKIRKAVYNIASGQAAHVEGRATVASGDYSHAEGGETKSEATYSHAEGHSTVASGESSHAEGTNTTSSGYSTHAEGAKTTASGSAAHAEGYNTIASANRAHAEGESTEASGPNAHSEGIYTKAVANASHAEGRGTEAHGAAQHVQGKYNVKDTAGKYAHIIGNGSSDTNRKNANTVDWSGNGWFAGSVEATALILKSPNGTRFRIAVDDSGALSASALT